MDKARTGGDGGVFRALRVHNFRLFAMGQVLSVTGTWAMYTAQDWLVLSLSDNPGNALALVTALQFTPVLLLTLYGGRLADRYDKRALLTGANVISGVLAAGLAVLVFGGAVRLWQVCLFAAAVGVVNAVEAPTRMAFISELVGGALLPNASALSAGYFNVARIVGPAAAGPLIAAVGTGPVMAINAGSFLATVVGLRLMRPQEIRRSVRDPARSVRVVDGLRYIRGERDLVVVLGLVAAVGLVGMNFQLTVPLMARTVFDAGAAEFGLLTTGLAVGSLVAALLTTTRRTRPSARLVMSAAFGFGLAEAAAGFAPSFAAAFGLFAVTGFASLYFMQAANHRVQLGSDPEYRGRVMALYTLIMQGTTPLGAALVGGLTAVADARAGLYVGGAISAVAALAAWAAQRSWAQPKPGPSGVPGQSGVAGPSDAVGPSGGPGASSGAGLAGIGQVDGEVERGVRL
ncbi:MFS transporter [Frankia sp. AgPm24]|uniref:MFS transporter n=1 Tax=Frankia sp. AgPm24 TaxID=631128 RepID=UPI0035ADEA3D